MYTNLIKPNYLIPTWFLALFLILCYSTCSAMALNQQLPSHLEDSCSMGDI